MSSIKLHEELQELYDKSYNSSQTEWRKLCAKDKADNIVALCSTYPHSKILDIGAGEGSVLSRLSQINFGEEYHAIEITKSAVQIIQHCKINKLQDTKLFDGYTIPYEDKFFDLVILSHVVEHLEHPRILLYEAMRVSKYVFIEVPLEDTILQNSNFSLNAVGHLNFFTPRSIRFLAQSSGFKVINQRITNPSKKIYIFSSGIKGALKYYIRNFALKLIKPVAIRVFTYHSSMICCEKKIKQ